MTRLTAIALTLVLLSTPAGADDPPASATPPDPATPSASTDPPASTPPARPDFSAIQKHLVVVRDGPESDARQAPGFSISDQGHIVTYGGELRDRSSYLVSTGGGPFSATRLKADETTGLWILQLSGAGHGLTALLFASTGLHTAASLHAVNFNPSGSERFTSVPGTMTQLANTEQGQMIQHNALFSPASAGAPLLNRCFQAVGVNLLEKKGFFRRREVDPTQEGSAQSLASASLSSLLTSLNLSLPVVEARCLSAEAEKLEAEEARQQAVAEKQQAEADKQQAVADKQQAVAKAQQAEAEKIQAEAEKIQAEAEKVQSEEAKQRAEEAKQRAEAAKLQAEAAKQQAEVEKQQAEVEKVQAEEAQKRAEAAKQLLEDEMKRLEDAIDEERKDAEQRQRHILLLGSVIGGLALLGGVLLMRRKQKRLRATEQEKQHIEQEKQHLSGALNQAQSELSQAAEQDRLRSTAPDVFLEGQTPPIALKIPGTALVEQTGAVVGRSPSASTFVINHEQISRQHFRLSLVSHQVMIEDLGSTNGTSVDGVPLEPGQQIPVRAGSRLGLGDLELTLHIGG